MTMNSFPFQFQSSLHEVVSELSSCLKRCRMYSSSYFYLWNYSWKIGINSNIKNSIKNFPIYKFKIRNKNLQKTKKSFWTLWIHRNDSFSNIIWRGTILYWYLWNLKKGLYPSFLNKTNEHINFWMIFTLS